MRAPISFRINNRRKSLRISQAGLTRLVGISPSYLNLIENNKRDIGGHC
ncbi:MAG: helix-turn-helix transcriptional regulator [Candidatus Devosia euplotis]|nr:helix-turn-helix transcriptional regulator [Candidatus Devosia euplotis]